MVGSTNQADQYTGVHHYMECDMDEFMQLVGTEHTEHTEHLPGVRPKTAKEVNAVIARIKERYADKIAQIEELRND